MVFIGSYEHSIDEKNRLAIPAKFRSQWDPERDGGGFVIVPGRPAGTLWLYTDRHFDQIAARSESGLNPDARDLAFDQRYFPLAQSAELDSQGRILIPEKMLRKANLGREVVICGVRDHLEIRPRADFERMVDQCWDSFGQ